MYHYVSIHYDYLFEYNPVHVLEKETVHGKGKIEFL